MSAEATDGIGAGRIAKDLSPRSRCVARLFQNEIRLCPGNHYAVAVSRNVHLGADERDEVQIEAYVRTGRVRLMDFDCQKIRSGDEHRGIDVRLEKSGFIKPAIDRRGQGLVGDG